MKKISGQIDTSTIIIILALIGFAYLAYVKSTDVPDPKGVPEGQRKVFLEQLRQDLTPSLVLFYRSRYEVRNYFKVLEQLKDQFGSKINFYRYPLGNDSQDPFFKDYGRWEGLLVLFKNGREVAKKGVVNFSVPEANLGYAFMMIRDEIDARHFGVGDVLSKAEDFVQGSGLYEKILNSKGLVVVAIVSSECPTSRDFQPAFKRVAREESRFARFYMTDGSDKTEHMRIMEMVALYMVPSMAVFRDGQLIAKHTGGFESWEANEALIMGMIVPYL